MKAKISLGLFFSLAAVLFCGFLTVESAPQVRAVYLTWQRDPAHTMTVHWIGPAENKDKSVIYYRSLLDQEIHQCVGEGQLLPPPSEQFAVHEAELIGLQPSTAYAFSLTSTGPWYTFRTAPETLTDTVRFVVGGDMYHEGPDILRQANRMAASYDPLFVLAGGDLAYASQRFPHSLEDGQRWMDWLQYWTEDMVRSDGTLIPMIPVIGNHDVNGRYKQTTEHAQFFYKLFSMPGKPGYNHLDFGSYMTLFLLDSNHTNSIPGQQTEWLRENLQKRAALPHKFAAYHVPAYPSVRSFCGKYNPLIRRYWVKLFDEFGLHMAFEHHEHAYKRTHPLRGNRIEEHGTIYMGDGAWGTLPRTPRPVEERWYLAETKAAQHFIVIDVTPEQHTVTAVDVQRSEEFDHATQLLQTSTIKTLGEE